MFGLVPYNRRNQGVSRWFDRDIWDFKSLVDDFFRDSLFSTFQEEHLIRADIKEYILEAELPGFKKEDINIDIRDDVLTLSVESKKEIKEEKENYVRRERRYGAFKRSFYLDNVNNEGVKARYENGILTVILPKAEPAKPKTRSIKIE